MSRSLKSKKEIVITTDDSRDETSANSLLPMLIWGLALIVIGAVVVMYFV